MGDGKANDRNAIHPQAKLTLAGGEKFYGPGTQRLLELVEKTGSVRLACGEMDLSYSKGWKMIRNMERQLGYAVVERRQGGARGGASVVTPAGKKLMEQYARFAGECREQIQVIFEKYFAD